MEISSDKFDAYPVIYIIDTAGPTCCSKTRFKLRDRCMLKGGKIEHQADWIVLYCTEELPYELLVESGEKIDIVKNAYGLTGSVEPAIKPFDYSVAEKQIVYRGPTQIEPRTWWDLYGGSSEKFKKFAEKHLNKGESMYRYTIGTKYTSPFDKVRAKLSEYGYRYIPSRTNPEFPKGHFAGRKPLPLHACCELDLDPYGATVPVAGPCTVYRYPLQTNISFEAFEGKKRCMEDKGFRYDDKGRYFEGDRELDDTEAKSFLKDVQIIKLDENGKEIPPPPPVPYSTCIAAVEHGLAELKVQAEYIARNYKILVEQEEKIAPAVKDLIRDELLDIYGDVIAEVIDKNLTLTIEGE